MLSAAEANLSPVGFVTTAGSLAVALMAIGALVAWLVLPRFEKRIADTVDERMAERLKDVDEAAGLVKHELKPNNGGSLHDHARVARETSEENQARLAGLEERFDSHLHEAASARARQYQVERDVRAITRLLVGRLGRRAEDLDLLVEPEEGDG